MHSQIDFLVQDQIEGCVVRSVPPQWSCWDASSDLVNAVITKTMQFPFGIKFEITHTPTQKVQNQIHQYLFFFSCGGGGARLGGLSHASMMSFFIHVSISASKESFLKGRVL